jgi:hypothetical protein
MKNWKAWLKSLAAAFISGGSGALGTGVTLNIIAPEHFNLHSMALLLKVTAVSFLSHGAIGVFLYLRDSPFPKES